MGVSNLPESLLDNATIRSRTHDLSIDAEFLLIFVFIWVVYFLYSVCLSVFLCVLYMDLGGLIQIK